MCETWQKMMQGMLEQSEAMLRNFKLPTEGFSAKGFEDLMPTMPKDVMEMFFGKTHNPGGLDAKTRLLVTLSALTVLGAQAEPQVKLTVRHALEAGATQREIAEVISQMSLFGGLPAVHKALEIAQTVFAEVEEKNQ